jgi:hypothetical protein
MICQVTRDKDELSISSPIQNASFLKLYTQCATVLWGLDPSSHPG